MFGGFRWPDKNYMFVVFTQVARYLVTAMYDS